MTDNKDNQNRQKKTLTIKSGTLGLNKNSSKLGIPSGGLKQNAIKKKTGHGKSTVVVVTKASKPKQATNIEPSYSYDPSDFDGLTPQEIERRIELIKKAEEERKAELERREEEERKLELEKKAREEKRAKEVESKKSSLDEKAKLIDKAEEEAIRAREVEEEKKRKEELEKQKLKEEEESRRRNEELKMLLSSKGKVKNLNSLGIQPKPVEKKSDKADEQKDASAPNDKAKDKGAIPNKVEASKEADKKTIPLPIKKKGKGADEDDERAVVPSPVKRSDDDRRSSNRISVTQVMMMDSDDAIIRKTRSLASLRRAREKAKKHESNYQDKEKLVREVVLPDFISVQELSNRMAEKAADVIKALMKLGMMVTLNQSIDADTAELIVSEFGHKIKRVTAEEIEKNLLSEREDTEDMMSGRPPVVTVMGHVDHGKTSLLDALRSTDVAVGEAGGITQHIGAYQVTLENGNHITFLDTPGHKAFTAMRSRGAKVTDIVILVVAADDGIMPQTVEAINHAKAANVPIIVAINKIDKPEADPLRVKNELLSHGLVPEDMGGDIITVEVSAKKRMNLDKLEESILLQAEMLNLKANPNRLARGIVIEAKVDKGRGPVATVLVQKGTLRNGNFIVAGTTSGKIRALVNDKGVKIDSASPSVPVEILGLSQAPVAGDEFVVTEAEKLAKDIAEFRINREKERALVTSRKASLEQLFLKARNSSSYKVFNIIIKADVQGSAEAIQGSLTKLANDEISVNIIHSGVGAITESDITLANASSAFIIGFNVRANNLARDLARKYGIEIRYYSIIYNLVDDVKAAMSGMLSPIVKEEILGYLDVKDVFDLSKFGKVAGCYVTEGVIKRQCMARLLRDSVVIFDGRIKALKRFKEDVKEVKTGFECGVSFENYEDIRVGDRIEAYEITEHARTL